MGKVCLGRKIESVTDAGSQGISGGTVGSRRTQRETETESVVVLDDFHEMNNKEIGEKRVVDEAEARMDRLEGKLECEEEEICLIYEEDIKIESKVHDTLR